MCKQELKGMSCSLSSLRTKLGLRCINTDMGPSYLASDPNLKNYLRTSRRKSKFENATQKNLEINISQTKELEVRKKTKEII